MRERRDSATGRNAVMTAAKIQEWACQFRVPLLLLEQRRRCESSNGTHVILMDSASGTGF